MLNWRQIVYSCAVASSVVSLFFAQKVDSKTPTSRHQRLWDIREKGGYELSILYYKIKFGIK